MLAPCYFCRRCLAARLSFFSPSRGAHPQRTISAPASLPVLNRAHCFFSTVGSHERKRIIICISALLSSRRARSRVEGILSRYHPPARCSREGSLSSSSCRTFSRGGNRIAGYFYFFARKKRFERFERVEGEIGEGSVKERRRRSPPRIDA